MRVISLKTLVELIHRHPNAAPAWKAGAKPCWGADWNSLAAVKKLYPRADQVGRRTVFNISGYQFRLVARMNCLRGPRVVETTSQWEGASWFDVNGLMNGWKPTKSDDTIRTRTGFTAEDAERNCYASKAVSAG